MSEKEITQKSPRVQNTPDNVLQFMTPRWPIFISLVAFIAALISAFYSFSFTEHLSSFKETSSTLQSQINEIKLLSDQQQVSLQTLQSNIKMLIKKHRAQKNWKFSELHYLIQSAHWQLTFQKNSKMALAFLSEALKKANALNDSALLPLVSALNNDIAALQAITPVSVSEILRALSSINQQLAQLPRVKKIFTKKISPPNTVQIKRNIWQRGLEKSLSAIKDVIIIRRSRLPSSVLIKPEERGYLIDNLQLQLGMAQWALLNHKQKLFKQSIMTTQHWIKTYFETHAPSTKHVLNFLESLATLNIAPQLPDISGSLTAMNNIINAKAKE